jgi:hypothetical protein
MFSQNNGRVLKSTLYSTYLDFRKSYGIFLGVILGILVSSLLLSSLNTPSGISDRHSSALDIGFMTGMITLCITMFVITSNGEILKKFSFPVNRITLLISHGLLILASPLVMLLTACACHLLEYLAASLISELNPGMVFTWIITKESFSAGFIFSYFIMVFAAAMTYCIAMYFYRHKIATGIVGLIIFILCLYVESFLELLDNTISFLLGGSIGIVSLKLLTASLVAMALAFIPLKRMEVKKS